MITPTDTPNHFVAEASSVGFAAGVWPISFVWNGETFYRMTGGEYVGEELVSREYRTVYRPPTPMKTIVVLND